MSPRLVGWRGLPVVDLAAVCAGFGARLHAAGIPVTPERSSRFAAAVLLGDPTALGELYWLARVTLVTAPDQLPIFDALFAHVFRGWSDLIGSRGQDSDRPLPPAAAPAGERSPGDPRRGGETSDRPSGTSGVPGQDGAQDPDDQPSLLAAASSEERLRTVDFADCTATELAEIASLVSRLAVEPPLRHSRRTRRTPHAGTLDVRATLRRAHRSAGDPVVRVHRGRSPRRRRVVLLADISGSMAPYARMYLHLLRGAVVAWHAEAFVFATRLTRLTKPLASRSPDAAYRQALQAAPDWSGGTRIGAALKEFLDGHGRRGIARGAVVVVVSDGWDTGDPALLAEQARRLQLMAHRVVWVNPRSASSRFAPATAGMRAVLPYVDVMCSGHSLVALEGVLAAIRSDSPRITGRGRGSSSGTALSASGPSATLVRLPSDPSPLEGDGVGTAWNRESPATHVLSNMVSTMSRKQP